MCYQRFNISLDLLFTMFLSISYSFLYNLIFNESKICRIKNVPSQKSERNKHTQQLTYNNRALCQVIFLRWQHPTLILKNVLQSLVEDIVYESSARAVEVCKKETWLVSLYGLYVVSIFDYMVYILIDLYINTYIFNLFTLTSKTVKCFNIHFFQLCRNTKYLDN